MGQLVGTLFQLSEGQRAIATHQRHGVGTQGGLLADGLMHQRQVWRNLRWLAPGVQLAMLVIGQPVQYPQRLLRLLHDLAQHRLKTLSKALDTGRQEHIHGIGERQHNTPAVVFAAVQPQVKLGGGFHLIQGFQGQLRQVSQCAKALPLMVEQHLEQRVVAQAAFWMQRLNQLFEGQVLIGLGAKGPFAYLLQQVGKACVAIDHAAQHLSVDEQTDQPLDFQPIAVGRRHADTQVALATGPVQADGKGRQQYLEGRRALCLSELAQALTEGFVKYTPLLGTAIALHRRAREVPR